MNMHLDSLREATNHITTIRPQTIDAIHEKNREDLIHALEMTEKYQEVIANELLPKAFPLISFEKVLLDSASKIEEQTEASRQKSEALWKELAKVDREIT